MNNKIYLLLFILITASCGVAKDLHSKPIFRYVDLYQYGKIELGQDISKFDSLLEKNGDHKFLKQNVFGGSESIQLVQNSAGKISAIIFSYGNETDLRSKIKDYQYLGQPKMEGKNASWTDGKTLYEVYEENQIVYAKMTDLLL